jgi:HEPN domain-containing protein
MCFDAQQAAEKAVKAVLVLHEIEFPRTHELGELLALAHQAGEPIPDDLWEASGLSRYATHARYPGGEHRATENDYMDAVAMAEKVVRWAEGVVHGG